MKGNQDGVKVIRLLTGEEVIGTVSTGQTTIKVKKPVLLQILPGQNDQPMIGFAPYIPLAVDDSIEISVGSVLFMYRPILEIENQYNTRFGSGIIRPNLSLV